MSAIQEKNQSVKGGEFIIKESNGLGQICKQGISFQRVHEKQS